MGVYQTSWLILLAALGVSTACDLYTFGPCDEPCGGGSQMAVTKMCSHSNGDADSPCGIVQVGCNSAPCDDVYSDWSNCSDICGYGERTRTDMSGDIQTMFCNSISCESVDCPSGEADIIFVVDKSSSITDYGFEICKQLVSDVVNMLPAGGNVRVAMVSFSVQASTVFEFTNSPSVNDILGDKFTGGVGVVAYALQTVDDLFGSSVDVPKMAVFLTDGQQMLLEACANELSQQLQQSGVEMFTVGIGSTTMVNLYPFTSIPFEEHQFRAGFNSTAVKLANAILNVTCGQSNLLNIADGDEDALNPNMGEVMQSGTSEVCSGWYNVGSCEPCGDDNAQQEKHQRCTTGSESMVNKIYPSCYVPCPVDPDCSRCDYTQGQVWLRDEQNCHDYYICEKVNTWGGLYHWTAHHVSCGLLYWDQSRLTCTTMIQPGCTDQIGTTVEQSPTPKAPCLYEFVTGSPRKFRSTVDGSEQECILGMMFEPLICGCIPVSDINPSCSDDLLLYFPFNEDFDDVTCHHAKGYAYGPGTATIVDDAERGKVVHFDGNVRIEVPFMRNWFKDQCTTEFTVMFWYKRSLVDDTRVAIVHNGDCDDYATFRIGKTWGTGITGYLHTNNNAKTTQSLNNFSRGNWNFVALVYDGTNMKTYVNCQSTPSRQISGCITNVQNAMMIGADCHENPHYLVGYIDDLRVYTRAVSQSDIDDQIGDICE